MEVSSLQDLFQVRAHKINEIFSKFRSNLLLRAVDEMKTNVVFKYLRHQSIHAAADCGKQHKLVAAIRVGIDGTLYSVKLSAQFAKPLEQLHFLPFMEGHRAILLDTHPGYGI